jgi:hypothetical protein
MDQASSNEAYERLLVEKAERLTDLQNRKPGQKHYKRSLKAFLDADARLQKALLEKIEQEPRTFALHDGASAHKRTDDAG